MEVGPEVERIAEALGLKPPKQFASEGPSYEYRQTGRTTRMLLEAVALVSLEQRPVWIAAHNSHYTRELVNRAREMAREVGVDPDLIRRYAPPRLGITDPIFRDHYAMEVFYE